MRWTIGILVITLTLSWSLVCSQSTESESLTSSLDTPKKTEGEIADKPKKQQPAAPAKQSYSSLLTGIPIEYVPNNHHFPVLRQFIRSVVEKDCFKSYTKTVGIC